MKHLQWLKSRHTVHLLRLRTRCEAAIRAQYTNRVYSEVQPSLLRS